MRYVHAIKGVGFALIPIALVIKYVPAPTEISGVETTLTVSTFIFAILAGFYLSRSNNRYDAMRGVTVTEDAIWLSFYHSSKFYGKAFTNKMRKIIDKYYMVSVELELGQNYMATAPFLTEAFDALVALKFKNDGKKENVIDDMVIMLLEIEKNRNSASIMSKEKMGTGQWAIMVIITMVIFVALFYFKSAEIFSLVTTTLFAGSLILVLLVMRDLQNFRLGGRRVLYESAQEIFETMGLPRYYTQEMLKFDSIPEHVEQYRFGTVDKKGERKLTLVKK
ncbi:hypothetical protein HQ524_01475 [Candidatus Uhrbacteria bacterium]|nr:hypothetical protein [Candidatus Uhrbacteria bacterium]